MPKVDTKAWKSFRVGDLFGKACHGVWVNPKLLDISDDGLHIVSASTGDNGLSASLYVGADDKHVIPAHVITWGKQSPFFAYQVEPTISGQGVYYYDVGFLTERTALFLCAVMQSQIAERYNYQDCLIGERCDDEVIFLPATSDGQPDWAYMDAYMSEVLKKEEVFAEHLASLTVISWIPAGGRRSGLGNCLKFCWRRGIYSPNRWRMVRFLWCQLEMRIMELFHLLMRLVMV